MTTLVSTMLRATIAVTIVIGMTVVSISRGRHCVQQVLSVLILWAMSVVIPFGEAEVGLSGFSCMARLTVVLCRLDPVCVEV